MFFYSVMSDSRGRKLLKFDFTRINRDRAHPFQEMHNISNVVYERFISCFAIFIIGLQHGEKETL
jgi:hypothetical protein